MQKTLERPQDYSGTEHASLERFFTSYLRAFTKETPAHYNKGNLSKCYTQECCCKRTPCKLLTTSKKSKIDTILELFKNVDFSNFR